MPTLQVAPGLYTFSLTYENGETRNVLASTLASALAGISASPVVGATRGPALADIEPGGAAPVLTSLVPPTAALGAPAFTLHVHGTGFRTDSVIVWNGGEEPTTYVSATELTTGVDMSTAQVAIPIPVSVRTVAGLESNVLTFSLTPTAGATRREAPDAGGA